MKSMTGMGKANGALQGNPVRLEIKSVNHKFCEVNFRASGKYSPLEIPLQQFIKEHITRGRVDVFLFEEKTSELSESEIEGFRAYYKYLARVKETLKLKEEIGFTHLLAGVNSWVQKEMEPKKTWNDLKVVLEKALAELDDMRVQEGNRLKENIKDRFSSIRNITKKIEKMLVNVNAELTQKIKERISARVEEIGNLDPQRLQTEVIFYLDRMDVSEELERLKSHAKCMDDFLQVKEPVGRKIDFLLQEFNREFNTIASKAQNSQIAHLVVDAKSELEKIREQIQNIE